MDKSKKPTVNLFEYIKHKKGVKQEDITIVKNLKFKKDENGLLTFVQDKSSKMHGIFWKKPDGNFELIASLRSKNSNNTSQKNISENYLKIIA